MRLGVCGGLAAVVWFTLDRGPRPPRLLSASCRWDGAGVRVSATVYNPNATPQDVVLRPTFRLVTGGLQGSRTTATVWTGRVPGGRMEGRGTARRTITVWPDARPWHAGEPIASCIPTAYIPSRGDD